MNELEEILGIADALARNLEPHQKDVVKAYKKQLRRGNINLARIISDEIMDYFKENEPESEKVEISIELYNRTMEYFDTNYVM